MITVFRFRFVKTLQAAIQPPVCQFHRLLGIIEIRRARCTLIKRHHDVCTNGTLDVHHPFRSEQMLGTVDVRTEFHTFFPHLTDTRQGKHLKTTTVCQHRAVKSVELVQSAGLFNHIQSRSQIQVIGIAQNNLGLNILFQLVQMDSLHRSQCSHRHKDRGFNLSMVGCYQSGPCIRLRIRMLQFKCHHACLSSFF